VTSVAADEPANGYSYHRKNGVNNNCYGNGCSWIGRQCTYTFRTPQTIQATAFGRDNTGGYGDRSGGTYTLSYREEGGGWKTAGSVGKGTYFREIYNAAAPLRNVIEFRLTNPDSNTCVDEWEVYTNKQ
jgi:hypothetical protein